MKAFQKLGDAIAYAGVRLRTAGYEIRTEKWQGVEPPAPMLEVLETSFSGMIDADVRDLAFTTQPNLPWAEEHFQERVSGIPYNPPPSAERWPFNPKSVAFRKDDQYTHTYPERMWCRAVGEGLREEHAKVPFGLRYEYGDLGSVVDLLAREPLTRQAFLPIFFPEDTGGLHGGRIPCTIGYWFVRRHGRLHATYYIRSCDFFRHFRDDVYMAGRLVQWLLSELKSRENAESGWSNVEPGFLNMHIGSLHCWLPEKRLLP